MVDEKWKLDDEYKEVSICILQDNLISLRAKAGINQEQLSSIIGISRQTYQAIETNKKAMSWTIYLALLLFFYMLESTHPMIEELRIFPIELFMRFNDRLVRE